MCIERRSKYTIRWSRTPPSRFGTVPDHLTLYDATQGVFTDRERVASLFGLPARKRARHFAVSRRRIRQQRADLVACDLGAMAAKQVNRPVKLAVAAAADVRDGGLPLRNAADRSRRAQEGWHADGAAATTRFATLRLSMNSWRRRACPRACCIDRRITARRTGWSRSDIGHAVLHARAGRSAGHVRRWKRHGRAGVRAARWIRSSSA